ncbi:MAG TPA: hypothetical protein VG275_09895 [Solirubrobacteraceae bacterium]|jgi:hypothetical protein|nr:hypothetical protein [Solirubrobacteraceae bacterium]
MPFDRAIRHQKESRDHLLAELADRQHGSMAYRQLIALGLNPSEIHRRALMAGYRGAPDTRSGNERRFLALIGAAGLPEPSVNVFVAGIVVDFFWAEHRLVVEVDSYA